MAATRGDMYKNFRAEGGFRGRGRGRGRGGPHRQDLKIELKRVTDLPKICEQLRRDTSIVSLKVTAVLSLEEMRRLMSAFENNKKLELKYLSFRGCQLTPKHLEIITGALLNYCYLEILDLGNNNFGSHGLSPIAAWLLKNPNSPLQKLLLDGNQIAEDGLRIFGIVLKLAALNVQEEKFPSHKPGAKAKQSIVRFALKEIDLSNNPLSASEIKAFSKMLKEMPAFMETIIAPKPVASAADKDDQEVLLRFSAVHLAERPVAPDPKLPDVSP